LWFVGREKEEEKMPEGDGEDLRIEKAAVGATVFLEARGEPDEGEAAVAFVILERMKRRRRTVFEVIFDPWDFSCYHPREFDSELMCAAIRREDAAYEHSCEIARKAVDGMIENPAPGADHYFNYRQCDPSWAKTMRFVRVIGKHVFLDSRGI